MATATTHTTSAIAGIKKLDSAAEPWWTRLRRRRG